MPCISRLEYPITRSRSTALILLTRSYKMTDTNQMKAEVIAVFPDKVKISVDDIAAFAGGQSMKVGSYLRITDSEDCALIAIIENFCIEVTEKAERRHIIEALPLGIISDGKFIR